MTQTDSPASNDLQKTSITYSIADQDFQQTKSIGILNLSRWLFYWMQQEEAVSAVTLLSNHTVGEITTSNINIQTVITDTALRGTLKRIAWDQWFLYSAANRAGNEWLFLPKGFSSIVRKPPCKLATYVSDDIICYWAQNYPHTVSKMEASYFSKCFQSTLRNSSAIFTGTEFSKSRILARAAEFDIPEPQVTVCGMGFEHISKTPTAKTNSVIVLVGKWPHKRSAQAIEYVRRWQERSGFNGCIQFVGSLPRGTEIVVSKNWMLDSRLPQAEYSRAMKSAQTLVYFSEYEGFGMPPVEAILGGTCAVYSDIPATREVMEGAGHAFSNDSFESFYNAMQCSLTVSPEDMSCWQSQLSERHSWHSTSNIIVNTLSKLSQ